MPGDPVMLYNIWDVGSALAVVKAGAKALATGQPPGRRCKRVWRRAAGAARLSSSPTRGGSSTAVDPLPLTVDFEGAYSTDPEAGRPQCRRSGRDGAVGCNFEDQVIGGEGVHPLELQVRRIEAIRRAVGDDFFINARTDLFLKAAEHGRSRWSMR